MARGRVLISAMILLFGLCAGALGQPRECDLNPTLFANDGLRGRPLRLNNSVTNLHSVGFGDSASSLCVPAGWRVVLYEDTGYRGDILEIVGPAIVNDLKRDRPQGRDWGDRISSVEVVYVRRRGNADCNQYPTLYGNDGHEGNRYEIRDSVGNLHRAGIGDQASSVCVPDGWKVVLYEDTDYRGDSLVLDGYTSINDLKRDRPQGRDWGDRISSVRVERSGRSGGRNPVYPDPRRGRGDDSRVYCEFPTFYENSNFRGRTLVVDNSLSDLYGRGFGNRISSACIPSGWTLSLYSERDYRGARLVLRGDQSLADLSYDSPDRQNWGDRVNSIRVEPSGRFNPLPGIRLPGNPPDNSAHCRAPVLYSNDSFRGRTLEVKQSIPDLHSRGFGDEASSVCVPSGWQIVLYSETNYRGSSLVVNSGQEINDLRRDRPSGQDWGDIASSVRITRSRNR